MQHKLIGRGQVDWHSDGVESGNKCSSSGGSLEHYLSEAEDGTPIYDASEADLAAFCELVIGGPMVQTDLPPGTVSKFGEKAAMARMLPGLGGEFATIAKAFLIGMTSLDYVATDIYLGMLRQIPGCKIGKVINHTIMWDT